MRQEKKVERSVNEIAKRLAEFGIDPIRIEKLKDSVPETSETISRQGEAVSLWLYEPHKFTTKLCKRCGEPFATNYRSVAYCSDPCRAHDISEQIGVKWNYFKSEEERWGGEPPLVIPPRALQMLLRFVLWFVDTQPTHTGEGSLPQITSLYLDQVSQLKEHSQGLGLSQANDEQGG